MRRRIRKGIALCASVCLFIISARWIVSVENRGALYLVPGNVTTPAIVLPSSVTPATDFNALVHAPIATMSANRVSLHTNGRCTYTVYADDDTLGSILIKRLRIPDYLTAFLKVHAKEYPSVRALSSKVKPGWIFLVPCPETLAALPQKPTSSKEALACMYAKNPEYAFLFTISGDTSELPGAKVIVHTSKSKSEERVSDEKGAVCFSDIKDRITGVDVSYGGYNLFGALPHMPNRHHFPLRVRIIREGHRFVRLVAVLCIVSGLGFACLLLVVLKKQRIRRLQEALDAEQLAEKKSKIRHTFTQQFPYQK